MKRKRLDRQNACDGKVAYDSRKDARYHLHRVRARYQDRSIEEYRCPFCYKWHHGHMADAWKRGF